MEHRLPSERYLAFQRGLTFLDEWLFYVLLIYLFVNQHYWMMVPVVLIGATAIWYSYRRQWSMEKKRFGQV